MKNELKDHIITEHVIMCFADGCNNEVRDTDDRHLAETAEDEGFVVIGDETFCAEHAEQD